MYFGCGPWIKKTFCCIP